MHLCICRNFIEEKDNLKVDGDKKTPETMRMKSFLAINTSPTHIDPTSTNTFL